nr:DUF885 family protein [Asaia platycodi]
MKSPRLSRLALLGFGCLLGATTALASPAWAAAPDSKAETAFDKLLDEEWQYQLKNAPELATSIGDYRYNDRWSDLSLAHIKGSVPVLTGYLKRFEAIAPASLDDQRQISRAMIIQQLQDSLEGIRLKTYEMPIDQMNGAQLQYPGFVSSIPFDTTKHYEDYLARLRAIPKLSIR